MGNKIAKRNELQKERKKCKMYVNREEGLLRNTLFVHDLTPTATTVRETRSGNRGRDGGSTDGVKEMASRS